MSDRSGCSFHKHYRLIAVNLWNVPSVPQHPRTFVAGVLQTFNCQLHAAHNRAIRRTPLRQNLGGNSSLQEIFYVQFGPDGSESYPFVQQIIAQFVLTGAQVDYTLGEEEGALVIHWRPPQLDVSPRRLTSGLSVSWYLSSE